MSRHARVPAWLLAALLACYPALLGNPSARADKPPVSRQDKSRLFLQRGLEPAEPFVPLHPRTLDEVKQLEALKHFCVAHRLENRHRWLEAIKEYEKALEYDPKAVAIYKRLIYLCRITNRVDKSNEYLRRAVQIDPDDYRLRHELARYLIREERYQDARDMYRQALGSPRLAKDSAYRVLLHYELGILLEMLQDYQGAADSLAHVMKALHKPAQHGLYGLRPQPKFVRRPAETYKRIGDLMRRAERYDQALEAYRHAQERSTRIGRIRLLKDIALVYVDQEQYQEALKYLEQYLDEQRPQGSEAYELLASILEKLGRSDQILPRLEAAAKQERFNLQLQFYLATQYEKAGRVDEAKEIYLQVFRQRGDNRVYDALARIYQRENNLRQLIRVLGEGLQTQFGAPDRDPRLSEALDAWLQKFGQDAKTARQIVETAVKMLDEDSEQLGSGALLLTARLAAEAKMVDTAVRFYRLSIGHQRRPPGAVLLYLEMARMLADNGRDGDGVKALQEAIDKAGGDRFPQIYAELARLLGRQGKTEEALQACQHAIDMRPDYFYAYIIRADVYVNAGQLQKAAETYQEVIRRFEGVPDYIRLVHYQLSDLYVLMGDMPKAEAELEVVLKQYPNDASANNNLGYLWTEQGKNLEKAQKMIRKALDQEPNNAAYLDSMGWVLFKLNQPEKALKYLEQAIQQEDGHDGVILDHLGDVYYRLGKRQKAAESWQEALKLLDQTKGHRREEKRIQEVRDKIKGLKDSKTVQKELRPGNKDVP